MIQSLNWNFSRFVCILWSCFLLFLHICWSFPFILLANHKITTTTTDVCVQQQTNLKSCTKYTLHLVAFVFVFLAYQHLKELIKDCASFSATWNLWRLGLPISAWCVKCILIFNLKRASWRNRGGLRLPHFLCHSLSIQAAIIFPFCPFPQANQLPLFFHHSSLSKTHILTAWPISISLPPDHQFACTFLFKLGRRI